jgi:hypothetical protein
MTTIAFDGRYLAADTQSSRGGIPSNLESRKIIIEGGFAYAVNGEWGPVAFDLIKWHQSGAEPDELPKHGEGSLLVVELSSRRCWVVSGPKMPYLDEEAAPFTGGSGGDIALGAIDAGLNAMEAVRIASKRDLHTNDTIDFVDLDWPNRGVQRWDGGMPTTRCPMPVHDMCEKTREAVRDYAQDYKRMPLYRVDTDEEGNARVTLAQEVAHVPQVERAGVIGKADICTHGYVRVTCSRCIREVTAAVARVSNGHG